MNTLIQSLREATAFRIRVFGYAAVALVGAAFLSLPISSAVMIIGMVIIFCAEPWPVETTFAEKLTASDFQSISDSSTGGFTSLEITVR
jgi:hypothetical protein